MQDDIPKSILTNNFSHLKRQETDKQTRNEIMNQMNILKTKDVFKLSAADYLLKIGNPSNLEKMKPIDDSLLIEGTNKIEGNACRVCGVATTKNRSKLIKILEFSHFFKHFVFVKDKDGYLSRKQLRAVPVSVFYYMV